MVYCDEGWLLLYWVLPRVWWICQRSTNNNRVTGWVKEAAFQIWKYVSILLTGSNNQIRNHQPWIFKIFVKQSICFWYKKTIAMRGKNAKLVLICESIHKIRFSTFRIFTCFHESCIYESTNKITKLLVCSFLMGCKVSCLFV